MPLVPRARAAGARRGGGGVGRGEHEAVTHILRVQQVVLPEDLEVGAKGGGEAAELGHAAYKTASRATGPRDPFKGPFWENP